MKDLSDFTGNYGVVKTLDGVKQLADLLMTQGKTISFDVETGYSGADRAKGSLDIAWPYQFVVGFSITNSTQWARYLPLRHDFGDNLDPPKVWEIMKPVLETLEMVAHNSVFECRNLAALERKGDGPAIYPPWQNVHDSMLQSYVLSETQHHGLKYLTQFHYEYEQKELNTLFGGKMTQAQENAMRYNVLSVTPETVSYVCDDVMWCLRLDKDFRPQVLDHPKRKLIYQMEREIASILVDMANTGIAMDWAGINQGLNDFDYFYQQMEQRTRNMFEQASGRDLETLNFRSVPQLRALLFDPEDGLGLVPSRMTKNEGNPQPSTDEVSLEALRHQHPAVEQLLKYRQTKKMGEWFQQWAKLRTSDDERVHPSLNQIRVQSGRFASDAPNVQNVTKKWWFSLMDRDPDVFPFDKEGNAAYEAWVISKGENGIEYWTGNARDYFIASPGYTLLSFDYKTAEMRVLAGLSQEPYLLKAFEDGVDVHIVAASLAFKVPIDQVTDEQRQRAKAVNFGLVYGQGAKGLADGLGITKDEAQEIMDAYFSAFTKVDGWFKKVRADGYDKGYVESFMGRKSTIWELHSPSRAVQSKADRMFVNIPVQGGAADYCKLAMIRCKRALMKQGWWNDQVRMLMNQHDSLVFEVSDELDLEEVRDFLQPQVCFPVKNYPLMEVDWEFGQRWGSVKKFTQPEPEAKPERHLRVVPDPVPQDSQVVAMFTSQPTLSVARTVVQLMKEHPGSYQAYLSVAGQERELPFTTDFNPSLAAEISAMAEGLCAVVSR